MIELRLEDVQQHDGEELIFVPRCAICMVYPKIQVEPPFDERLQHHELSKFYSVSWRQVPRLIPSNRVCPHVRHLLDCRFCIIPFVTHKEIAEVYELPEEYRQIVLEHDKFTCQACGFKQAEKISGIKRQGKDESDQEYLYRLFMSNVAHSGGNRTLHVAHFHPRYGFEETPENRLKPENSRVLCSYCHDYETSLHQMKEWEKRFESCPILQKLE